MPWGRHLGGVPISHNAMQDYPEFHGADTWGVPCQVQLGGGVPCQVQPGGYPARGYPARGYPARRGVPCQQEYPAGGYPPGGYPARGCPARGTLPGRYPGRVYPASGIPYLGTPPGRVPPQARSGRGEGTQLGQQKEYSLHGGRYATCVHAGGLSCWLKFLKQCFVDCLIKTSYIIN